MPTCASGRPISQGPPGVQTTFDGTLTFAERTARTSFKVTTRYDRTRDGGAAESLECALAELQKQPAGQARDQEIEDLREELNGIAELEPGRVCEGKSAALFALEGNVLSLGVTSEFQSTCEDMEPMQDIKYALVIKNADHLDLSPIDASTSNEFCDEGDQATLSLTRITP